MSLKLEQIEHRAPRKSGARRWMKNQRNRKIRRVPATETPAIKYLGWEYLILNIMLPALPLAIIYVIGLVFIIKYSFNKQLN